ncbi:23S rRNA (uracil(1939)-C(5))-methyltransferase RlmD [Colwellia maritima]|uniref:23S rRNA (uracil(1939)-C(5))-methyltransferase RlmD n=1 Tax=Colwellia maritima TaxID=2912588 RepID=UPI003084379B
MCGGCDLQHLDYSAQLSFKQSKIIELFSRAGLAVNVLDALPWQSPISSSQWHYRRKARIGVQFDKNAYATIGFRQRSTNQLVAVKSCPVLVKPADDIFPLLKALINQLSVKKAIGHIEVICTDNIESHESSKNITLIVRQIRTINDHDRELWQAFANNNQLRVYFQHSQDDSQDDGLLTSGDELNYHLGNEIQINFSNTDFIQINQQVNQAMVEQAIAWLAPEKNDLVLDLFCGLGNFSLPLAKKVSCVVGVEGIQSMVDKAASNASFNHIDNCQFFQADLNNEWLSPAWANNKFTKVLLDPPVSRRRIRCNTSDKTWNYNRVICEL